jgi:hypothetical protein
VAALLPEGLDGRSSLCSTDGLELGIDNHVELRGDQTSLEVEDEYD